MKHLEVVLERAHPRRHLLLLGAGQEADVLADADGRARHDDFGESALVDRLGEGGGKGHQGLARARLTEQRDEVDLGIGEQVERHVLFGVARMR